MGWLHWMVCRKCIRWYIFQLKLNHTSDWVWLLIHEVSRRTTNGRTPLDELSSRHRDLYPTTHNNHNRQTSMPPVGIEPTAPAGERPQTYALNRTATGTDPIRTECSKAPLWSPQISHSPMSFALYSYFPLFAWFNNMKRRISCFIHIFKCIGTEIQ